MLYDNCLIMNATTSTKPQIHVETTPFLVGNVYEKLYNNISLFRKITDRPLSICEKILIGHLDRAMVPYADDKLIPGTSYVLLNPDRVALQDVTGQMTILQFMQAGLMRTVIPTTVHCDHLIQARVGSEPDTQAAIYENNEVYQFLESAGS